jgi:hypothetical protein
MRSRNNLRTMIDNVFINKFKNGNYSVYPSINGLPDRDAQIVSLYNILLPDDRN